MNSNAVKRKYQKCVDRMKNMKKKPEFHGSDLEKIADYYHLNKENIILFGANVNPLGLSGQVKKDLAEHLDIISSYPDRDYTDLKKAIAAYTNTSPEHIVCRKWFYGAYLTSDQPARTKKSAASGTDLFRICKRAESGRRHTGIL